VERKQLVRDVKRAALARLENAARTAEDFQAVIKQWDDLDENRERRERAYEVVRNEKIPLEFGRKKDGLIFPVPFTHPAWQEAIKGNFVDIIYDNAEDISRLVEDWDVFIELENLNAKQKEVLFLTAVRMCTPQQIACYKDQTDRAVRKLLAATLTAMRGKLAESIREQIEVGMPDMTLTKRQFLEWYDGQKIALDNDGRE
jgi:DNA-directed RNA polymerase specialized sigma24 family protein